jgi:hypothetical protein
VTPQQNTKWDMIDECTMPANLNSINYKHGRALQLPDVTQGFKSSGTCLVCKVLAGVFVFFALYRRRPVFAY